MTDKKIIYSLIAGAAIAFTACDKDGDMLYTDGADRAEISTSATKIVLDKDKLNALALTFYWTENGDITLDNPQVLPPGNAVTNTVEMSADENFASKYEETVEGGVYERNYTVQQLNTITGVLGMEPGMEASLYIRVRSSAGVNVEPKYSDVIKLSVTPYFIDKTIGFYLDKDKNDTGIVLRSAAGDGVFNAFVGAAAWENWWFLDPLKNYWGNSDEGTPFRASCEPSSWNFWFPGVSGSYYITVDTNESTWSALHIESIALGGDITGEMTYNKAENQWVLPVNMAQAGTVNITISGQASLYNIESGTDNPASVSTIAFSGNADALTFGSSASTVSISVPAGDGAIVLDLNDVLAPKVAAGAYAPVETVPDKLYFSGLVSWDAIEDYLTLTDSDARTYGGAHFINSEWGYRAYASQDWNDAYKAADGATPLAGNLIFADSDGNIPAPEAGLYVMNFNMSALSYALTKVESVACTGLGDDWSVKEMTADPANPEVYTYEYTKAAETPWGVKVLFNNDWSLFLGGGEKEDTAYLYTDSGKSGFAGDAGIAVGSTVVLTVDLGKQTFSYTVK